MLNKDDDNKNNWQSLCTVFDTVLPVTVIDAINIIISVTKDLYEM